MSFLSSAFSGASNNFKPAGSDEALANYQHAGTGLDTLSQALQNQMAGKGPNLANQQLQNATGQNIANQAALMAGQRGASANPGLMARQIANNGANIQQQAAGQSASNVLQQQLAAQGQLGSVLGTQGNLGANVMNANNTINADTAKQNAQMNQGLMGGLANGLMGPLSGIMGGGGGGGGGGIGSLASLALLAKGGPVGQAPVQNFATGSGGIMPGFGSGSNFGFNFVSGNKPNNISNPTDAKITNPIPGANYLQPTNTSSMAPNSTQIQNGTMLAAAKGGEIHAPFGPSDYRGGGQVKAQNPAQKATVSGNSYANDKIPGMLSEGETVIDRDTMADPGPIGKMARALSKHIEAKRNKK